MKTVAIAVLFLGCTGDPERCSVLRSYDGEPIGPDGASPTQGDLATAVRLGPVDHDGRVSAVRVAFEGKEGGNGCRLPEVVPLSVWTQAAEESSPAREPATALAYPLPINSVPLAKPGQAFYRFELIEPCEVRAGEQVFVALWWEGAECVLYTFADPEDHERAWRWSPEAGWWLTGDHSRWLFEAEVCR